MWSNIGTVLLIAAVIGFTLLPIWPDIAKKVFMVHRVVPSSSLRCRSV